MGFWESGLGMPNPSIEARRVRFLETRTQPTIQYTNQLKLHGYISRRLLSLWLNDQSAATGSILFGGVDPAKYHGELRSTPVFAQQT